jgi:NAD(P)-dependent dehydrogenase (short-subunit alcohol dehydrogenase family)
LVKQLLAAGHTVVATTRGSSLSLSLIAKTAGDELITLKCDLASAESVKQFGVEFAEKVPRTDVLINNAGMPFFGSIAPSIKSLEIVSPFKYQQTDSC